MKINIESTKTTVIVQTGEVKVSGKTEIKSEILKSSVLGSCVAVAAIDLKNKVGGLAHVLLPGKAPEQEAIKTKYAFNAIDALCNEMSSLGADVTSMIVCIAGGAKMAGGGGGGRRNWKK